MSEQKLIVLEGIDGSGKSTQIELIKKYFKEHNLKYEYIHFPFYKHNEYGEVIAAYLRGEYGEINDVNPIFVANIYAMDRYLYLPTLQKQLLENDVVLMDRYVFSNMAYQGAKYNASSQSNIMRDWINEFEFGFLELPYPNLTIFLDVPISTVEYRLKEQRNGNDRDYLNGKEDIHEKDLEFQEKVRNNYLALKDYIDYYIIDCTTKLSGTKEMFRLDDPEEVFDKYKELLNNVFFIKKPL